MAIPLQISYRDVAQSDVLNAFISHESAKLERYFPRVLNCRVLIEQVHRRHRTGPYHLRIELGVPGRDIVINYIAGMHELPAAAARMAFKKAKRELQDYARVIAS